MSSYAYVAINPDGVESRGTLEVPDQNEALRRIKEMGLFPTKLFEEREHRAAGAKSTRRRSPDPTRALPLPRFRRGIRAATLAVFTRQLATLLEAGMPLLRSLRILQEQEENRRLKAVLGELAQAIENGGSFSEAIAAHPRMFSNLYLNMVRAGEMSGALDVTLQRLALLMEKAQRIKGKIKASMFYPAAVVFVAAGIVSLLMVFVVPRFQEVFEGLTGGGQLPAFTRFVFGVSATIKNHALFGVSVMAAFTGLGLLALKTHWGRLTFDRLKLVFPILGPVFRKAAVSRFARTLGTLMGNGVPILQALNIVKETADNRVLGKVIGLVHDNVKEGDPIAPTLKSSSVFPAMVAGMVDVGEQTGALPEMLMKIADNYDEEVDNAAGAMTSLLEPILIVVLAVVVGSIVIAMFLPIVVVATHTAGDGPGNM